jgi:O-antigen/teichoic acid export membrane protein
VTASPPQLLGPRATARERMALALQRLLGGQLVRSTATYAVADIVNKGIPFILLPVIAKYLAPADYGILANFSVLVQIFVAFCALNTYSALSVSYFGAGAAGLPSLVSNLLYLIAILATASLTLSLVLSGIIEQYLAIPQRWQLVALVTAVATAVGMLYLALLRMQRKAMRFGVVQIGQSLVSFLLAITFVVQLRLSWEGRALSMAAAAFAAMLFCLWSFQREGLLRAIDPPQIRGAFTFGLPLLPHTLSFWIKTGMVRIVITSAIGLSANGIYAIALTLGSIVGLFTDAFFSAYSPSMYEDLAKIDRSPPQQGLGVLKRLVRNTYRFAAVLAVVCVGGWLVMRIAIPLLFRGEYVEAVRFMPLVFLALYFDGLYAVVSGYIFHRRQTKVLGTITFVSAVVQVLLTVVLVQPFGIFGALYAGCLVSLMTFLAVLTVANRLYPLPWRLARS